MHRAHGFDPLHFRCLRRYILFLWFSIELLEQSGFAIKKKHRDLAEAPTHVRQVFTGSDLDASFCVSVYGVPGT